MERPADPRGVHPVDVCRASGSEMEARDDEDGREHDRRDDGFISHVSTLQRAGAPDNGLVFAQVTFPNV